MNTPGAAIPSGAASVAAGLTVRAAGKSGQRAGGRTATLEFRLKLRRVADRRLIGGADASKVMASADEKRVYAAYTYRAMECVDFSSGRHDRSNQIPFVFN